MKYIITTGGYSKEKFNLHKHKLYEIVFYASGTGRVQLDGSQYEIKKGDFLIVPPNVIHSSISYDNLRYISVIGNSDGLIHLTAPCIFSDDEKSEGETLAQMILENRYGNEEFASALVRAYVVFILRKIEMSSDIERAVYKIKKEISANFYDSDFDVTKVLNESGYAEDYIRAAFKKIENKTPVELLNEMRINNAKVLIKIYQNSMSLLDIAIHSGFDDYIYFSRKFKMLSGMSPQSYKKKVLS